MKRFNFEYKCRRWDQFEAFHCLDGPFIHFETGEVMVRAVAPHQRKFYEHLGVQLVSTTDENCPTLYFDEECSEPVTPAWLNQGGQQVLAVDHEQRVAVSVDGRSWRRDSKTNPELKFLADHVKGAVALWTGHERRPVVLHPITVSRPDPALKRKLKPKLDEVRYALVAAARMKGLESPWHGNKLYARPEWAELTTEQICAKVVNSIQDLAVAAHNGFTYPRKETKHGYLHIHKQQVRV